MAEASQVYWVFGTLLSSLACFVIHLCCHSRDLQAASSGTHCFLSGFFYYFERFLREYDDLFEKEYGYFRPVIQDVVKKYLDYSNPMCGSTRIRCSDCGEELLPMFSCKTRRFCPSCHAKRREEWGVILRASLGVFFNSRAESVMIQLVWRFSQNCDDF